MTQPLTGYPLNRTTLPLTAPDAVCLDDLDALGRETTSDLQSLVQDVYHSLIEDPDSNIDAPGRGVGIYSMLSAGATDPLQSIQRRVAAGILKDDRISTCDVQITPPASATDEYTIALTLGVGSVVLGLQFSFSAAFGLQFSSWQVKS